MIYKVIILVAAILFIFDFAKKRSSAIAEGELSAWQKIKEIF